MNQPVLPRRVLWTYITGIMGPALALRHEDVLISEKPRALPGLAQPGKGPGSSCACALRVARARAHIWRARARLRGGVSVWWHAHTQVRISTGTGWGREERGAAREHTDNAPAMIARSSR